MVHSHSLNNRFIAFPDKFKLVSHLCLTLLDLGMQAIEDELGRRFIDFDVWQSSDDGQICDGNFFVKNGFQFLIAVMFEHVFE